MSVARTVLMLDHDRVWSYRPGQGVYSHPQIGHLTLPELIYRASMAFPPEGGVLILAGEVAGRYGFPMAARGDQRQAPQVDGWGLFGMGGWWTYRQQDRPIVRVAIPAWMGPEQFPLGAADPTEIMVRHGRWHDMMGTPYYATPGAAALAALKYPFQGTIRPTWKPREAHEEWRTAELPWRAWRPTECRATGPLVGFDRVRAGLATFTSLEVAQHTLRRLTTPGMNVLGHGLKFSKGLAGMWRIYAAPWNDPRLPNPAGPDTPAEGGLVWRSTPTLALLQELTDLGVYGGFSITEAWVGNAERLFRPWAEKIRDGWETTWTMPAAIGGGLRHALKSGYRQAHGLIGAEGGAIERYDWWNAHQGLANALLWRRVWAAACQGVYPALVDGDCVYYQADGPRPTTFPLVADVEDRAGYRLGQYRPVEREGVPA